MRPSAKIRYVAPLTQKNRYGTLNAERENNPMTKEECLDKLDSFRNLPNNWNTYGAARPENTVIEIAKRTLSLVHTSPAKILPTSAGGITIKYKKDSKIAYLQIFNDEQILLLLTDGVSPIIVEEHTENEPEIINKTILAYLSF